jgi:hypothetical protein
MSLTLTLDGSAISPDVTEMVTVTNLVAGVETHSNVALGAGDATEPFIKIAGMGTAGTSSGTVDVVKFAPGPTVFMAQMSLPPGMPMYPPNATGVIQFYDSPIGASAPPAINSWDAMKQALIASGAQVGDSIVDVQGQRWTIVQLVTSLGDQFGPAQAIVSDSNPAGAQLLFIPAQIPVPCGQGPTSDSGSIVHSGSGSVSVAIPAYSSSAELRAKMSLSAGLIGVNGLVAQGRPLTPMPDAPEWAPIAAAYDAAVAALTGTPTAADRAIAGTRAAFQALAALINAGNEMGSPYFTYPSVYPLLSATVADESVESASESIAALTVPVLTISMLPDFGSGTNCSINLGQLSFSGEALAFVPNNGVNVGSNLGLWTKIPSMGGTAPSYGTGSSPFVQAYCQSAFNANYSLLPGQTIEIRDSQRNVSLGTWTAATLFGYSEFEYWALTTPAVNAAVQVFDMGGGSFVLQARRSYLGQLGNSIQMLITNKPGFSNYSVGIDSTGKLTTGVGTLVPATCTIVSRIRKIGTAKGKIELSLVDKNGREVTELESEGQQGHNDDDDRLRCSPEKSSQDLILELRLVNGPSKYLKGESIKGKKAVWQIGIDKFAHGRIEMEMSGKMNYDISSDLMEEGSGPAYESTVRGSGHFRAIIPFTIVQS